jgi:putative hydrolase of the HAD superfamily
MVNAILFDLGDTLLDFRPVSTRTLFEQGARRTYEYLQARGHKLPSYWWYYRGQFATLQVAYLWSRLRGREFNTYPLICKAAARMNLGLDEPALRELAWEWYLPCVPCATVAEDVAPTLGKLRERGYKLGIVSNTFLAGFVLDKHLELHDLLEYFPVRIYSSEVTYSKPDRRIFELALSAINADPASTLFVGDKVRNDIMGPRRMGMRTVLRSPLATAGRHGVADYVIGKISDLWPILANGEARKSGSDQLIQSA